MANVAWGPGLTSPLQWQGSPQSSFMPLGWGWRRVPEGECEGLLGRLL